MIENGPEGVSADRQEDIVGDIHAALRDCARESAQDDRHEATNEKFGDGIGDTYPWLALGGNRERHFDIWLASRFRVRADSSDETSRKASEWLHGRLAIPWEAPPPHPVVDDAGPSLSVPSPPSASAEWEAAAGVSGFAEEKLGTPAGVEVVHVGRPLQEAAILGFLLLSLEQRGGEAAARVEQLRREVIAQAVMGNLFPPENPER